jgi:hypothetical protein
MFDNFWRPSNNFSSISIVEQSQVEHSTCTRGQLHEIQLLEKNLEGLEVFINFQVLNQFLNIIELSWFKNLIEMSLNLILNTVGAA